MPDLFTVNFPVSVGVVVVELVVEDGFEAAGAAGCCAVAGFGAAGFGAAGFGSKNEPVG
jgi:hypothetical protein